MQRLSAAGDGSPTRSISRLSRLNNQIESRASACGSPHPRPAEPRCTQPRAIAAFHRKDQARKGDIAVTEDSSPHGTKRQWRLPTVRATLQWARILAMYCDRADAQPKAKGAPLLAPEEWLLKIAVRSAAAGARSPAGGSDGPCRHRPKGSTRPSVAVSAENGGGKGIGARRADLIGQTPGKVLPAVPARVTARALFRATLRTSSRNARFTMRVQNQQVLRPAIWEGVKRSSTRDRAIIWSQQWDHAAGQSHERLRLRQGWSAVLSDKANAGSIRRRKPARSGAVSSRILYQRQLLAMQAGAHPALAEGAKQSADRQAMLARLIPSPTDPRQPAHMQPGGCAGNWMRGGSRKVRQWQGPVGYGKRPMRRQVRQRVAGHHCARSPCDLCCPWRRTDAARSAIRSISLIEKAPKMRWPLDVHKEPLPPPGEGPQAGLVTGQVQRRRPARQPRSSAQAPPPCPAWIRSTQSERTRRV